MMSNPLYIALKKAVDDLGMDILNSPMLVNVLTDYHAFDVHDPNLQKRKKLISEFVEKGFTNKLLRWRNNRSTCINKSVEWIKVYFANELLNKQTATLVKEIAEAFLYSCGNDSVVDINVDIETFNKNKFNSKKTIGSTEKNKAFSKNSIINIILLMVACFGALLSPIYLVSMDSKFNMPGIVPMIITHIITYFPCYYWLSLKKTSAQTRSILLGMLVIIPFIPPVLLGLLFDWVVMISFVGLFLIVDFVALFVFFLLNDSISFSPIHSQQMIIGLILSIVIMFLSVFLIIKCNLISMISGQIGGFFAIAGIIIDILLLIILVIFYIWTKFNY